MRKSFHHQIIDIIVQTMGMTMIGKDLNYDYGGLLWWTMIISEL